MSELATTNNLPSVRGATVGANAGRSRATSLSRKQKAAIIVRLLVNEGTEVPLSELPEGLQEDLTQQMGAMRYVDRATLADVVSEFADELESIGLHFAGGIAGALSALDGKISPQTAARLRKEAGVRQTGDPWMRIRALPAPRLLDFITSESTEVAAVLLSKLDTAMAADILSQMAGPEARRITYAVSRTANVTPEAVDRIGLSLASQLDRDPVRAFKAAPVARVGAILNSSPAATRDALLSGLEEQDETFAGQVRKAIFTFENIGDRVRPGDVPVIMREVDAETLAAALAAASAGGLEKIVEFLLGNMSKRMAESLRDEMNEVGDQKPKAAEAAMNAVVAVIRRQADAGTITLITDEEEA
ncbi:MAG: FliG C-terminal domain-containing protein [Marinovum algicola]|uniref:Flagellar motor switch protein FliG n=1 Tax=Marinovum algicola TaxID=42444 RepID=A0A975ZMA5_9RHOB|nr:MULTISPECIES: FliG C-terminal domain-containing protein [Marinovum]MDD9738994.1 FliG C-terminal domain-containing protein [Marinovum sp. SP66]SEI83919.1 flagellar motor switch protein FliG [Marinovum algicola]SLN15687.1 Flagellar motor switch protein FliG [Marinovum algicola]